MRDRARIDKWAAFFGAPRSGSVGRPGSACLLLSRDRFVVARTLISAYYGAIFFLAAGNLYAWQGYLATTSLTPRWPVFWLRHVDLQHGIAAILWLHLIAGVLAVACSRFRAVRVLVFVSQLTFLAFKFSFGSINHGDHLGVLLSFVLIFLPAGWHGRGEVDRATRAATLLVFSGCQGLIMLLYSMSGLWKVGGVVEQWLKGEWITYLHPHGLAQQVAAKLLEDDGPSLLGPWLIAHPWVGWLPGIAALYFELFALWIVARPSLHRAWGLTLACLHLSTHLMMGVGFYQHTLWLTLFFVLSPFAVAKGEWQQGLRDLPLVGAGLRRLRDRTEAAGRAGR